MANEYKERLIKGFSKIEERRLVVEYVIINPKDYDRFKDEMGLEDGSSFWGAKVINADVHQSGLIQVCSGLFSNSSEPEDAEQVFSVVDISDL